MRALRASGFLPGPILCAAHSPHLVANHPRYRVGKISTPTPVQSCKRAHTQTQALPHIRQTQAPTPGLIKSPTCKLCGALKHRMPCPELEPMVQLGSH